MKPVNSILRFLAIVLLIVSCDNEEGNDKECVDVDGNVYKTVQIGNQVWMAENLKTTKFQNGDLIESTVPLDMNIRYNTTTPKYQWPAFGEENQVNTYGRYYTWFAVTDSRSLCPDGWHIATDGDWSALVSFLGGESLAGGKLKETGIIHWADPNTGATNDSGFTALGSGYRLTSGEWNSTDHYQARWWAATEQNSANGISVNIVSNSSSLWLIGNYKKDGLSVRCVKD